MSTEAQWLLQYTGQEKIPASWWAVVMRFGGQLNDELSRRFLLVGVRSHKQQFYKLR